MAAAGGRRCRRRSSRRRGGRARAPRRRAQAPGTRLSPFTPLACLEYRHRRRRSFDDSHAARWAAAALGFPPQAGGSPTRPRPMHLAAWWRGASRSVHLRTGSAAMPEAWPGARPQAPHVPTSLGDALPAPRFSLNVATSPGGDVFYAEATINVGVQEAQITHVHLNFQSTRLRVSATMRIASYVLSPRRSRSSRR